MILILNEKIGTCPNRGSAYQKHKTIDQRSIQQFLRSISGLLHWCLLCEAEWLNTVAAGSIPGNTVSVATGGNTITVLEDFSWLNGSITSLSAS